VIGWVDASSGASGDMLLGALAGAGVPTPVLQGAVDAVAPEPVRLEVQQVARAGLAATRCQVDLPDTARHRAWRDVRALLDGADLAAAVRQRAHDVFARLAAAEASVHGTEPDDVHFHEVGALDAIADVVGVCAGLEHLGLERLVVSPVAVGSGTVTAAHGTLPVPAPAVVALLRGVPSYAGALEMELCTPTGAALLTSYATGWGPQPAMSVEHVGVGAGGRDPEGRPNVLRLLVGEETPASAVAGTAAFGPAASTAPHGTNAPLLVESNVDDLDPRLWPHVIDALLEAGASDAWLSPIVMKKGRPAHTLHVLVAADRAPAVRRAIFRQTTTIGVREIPVGKHALERRMHAVTVDGHRVRVKLAVHDGQVVNAQPEYEDLAAAARASGRPLKDVLAEAVAAARQDAPWT
jgi:uncharacterized protein (TIGR00299 family) protein